MAKVKVKKIGLIISRDDFNNVLCDIMQLGCVDFTEPDGILGDSDLASALTREEIQLEAFDTNATSIVAAGTRETLTLTGWLSTKQEPALISALEHRICDWEIDVPADNETQDVPVILSFPWLFPELRKKRIKSRLFTPLTGSVRKSGEE